MNTSVGEYCVNSENCRRLALLRAVGSQETPTTTACGDVCEGGVPGNLQFEVHEVTSRKRGIAHRETNEALTAKLKAKLVEARDDFLESHSDLKMFGPSFVCSNTIIDEICTNARFY